MSPLGTYPAKSFLGASSALVVAPDICLSIVRLKDEWKLSGFSEIDCLLPIEIPLLATLTLAVDDGEQYILPYPTHQSMYMSASHEHALDSAAVTEAADWMRSYIKARKLEEEY